MPAISQILADIPRSRKLAIHSPYIVKIVLTLLRDICQPAISNQIIWVYWAFNVTTDLYIISIPVPMLWTSSLKPVKKIGLMILFSGGLFVVVCATLRCVLIVLVRHGYHVSSTKMGN